ncbi:MAG TPA: TetR/AcrR family transcriptional regulator [Bryobacteraceae bacterium]
MRKSFLATQTRKRTYHHGNLRQALIQSGLELIAEQGARALTLRELGKRAGVSRMAAYRHFRDRAALLDAIREAGFELFADALEQARLAVRSDFTSRMQALAVAYVRFARENPAYFEVMFSPSGDSAASHHSPAGERAFEALHGTIREGQTSGEVRAGNSLLLASAAWAIVHGISTLELDRQFSKEMAPEKFVEACSGIVVSGLRP